MAAAATAPAPVTDTKQQSSNSAMLKLMVEFSGGLELLFGKVKSHTVQVSSIDSSTQKPIQLKSFLLHIKNNLLKERPELFMQNDTVRPGILVLINETDWELEGGLNYVLQNNDSIVFISTLHGG